MSNFIKRISRQMPLLAIALIVGSGFITSCSSTVSEKTEPGKNSSANAENKANVKENGNAAAKETPKTAVNKETGGLPAFKVGEDYKTGVREKMLKAGWKPNPSEDADVCGSGDSRCDEYPELESCAGTGMGNCKFRWKRDDKVVAIFTVDDPYVYSDYEFEKASKTDAGKDEKWQSFWTDFKTAVDKQDSQSLRKMMADYITGGGDDSTTASQWLDSIQRNDSWAAYKKTVAGGTETGECSVPCRMTKDGYLIFEYRNGKWLWTSLGGEGGDD